MYVSFFNFLPLLFWILSTKYICSPCIDFIPWSTEAVGFFALAEDGIGRCRPGPKHSLIWSPFNYFHLIIQRNEVLNLWLRDATLWGSDVCQSMTDLEGEQVVELRKRELPASIRACSQPSGRAGRHCPATKSPQNSEFLTWTLVMRTVFSGAV